MRIVVGAARHRRSSLIRPLAFPVILAALTLGAGAQASGSVIGHVVDARSSLPIAGASIGIDSTPVGATTTAEGRYRIATAPAGQHTLVVRVVGYASLRHAVTVVAGQEATVDFSMTPSAVSLDEVVVTGTAGGEQKRSIGNVVSTINAPDVLAKTAAPDFSTLLNGRAPGVVVVPSTARLGGASEIEIRGRSSLSLYNTPLIYVDGVRVNNTVGTGPSTNGFGSQGATVAGRLNDIKPEDIERIEVIKGPSAATIYCTEAANGVVQIITKKGSASGKPQLTLNVQQGAIWFRDPEDRVPTNYVPDLTGATSNILAWNGVKTEEARGTPIFTTGHTRLYDLSLSGRRDVLQYYLSGAYEYDDGIEPNNTYKQFSTHANLNVQPIRSVDVGTSLNYVKLDSHLGADFGASPLLGAELGHDQLFPAARGFFPNFPPEIPQQLYDNSQGVDRFTGSITVNHHTQSWFSQRLIAGLDYSNEDSRGLEKFAPADLAAFLPPAVAAGQINQIIRATSLISADYSATGRFNLSHSLVSSTSIGGQYYRTTLDTSSLGGLGFPGEGVTTVSGTAQQVASTQDQTINTTIGGYVQEQLALNDRLFLTGGLRVDNNSAFGEDFKWVTYPKVSAAWVASEEPFWPAPNAINLFRLRAAYGESGQQPSAFSALRTFVPIPGPGGTSAVTPGSIGNSQLKPERGKELELGFDADFYKRVHVDFTYFNKHTYDEIIQSQVAPSSGFGSQQYQNIGQVDNHGIELQVGVTAISSPTVSWDITGTLASNNDVIKSLGNLTTVIGPGQNNVVGYPIYGYFAKRVVSADRDPNTNLPINVLCDGGSGQAPLSCDTAPLVYIGTPTPKWTGAIGNTLTLFKRLRLYALVDFKRGHRLLNATEQLRCTAAIGIGLCDANYHPERYSPIYLAELDAGTAAAGLNDQFIQDAGFFKLREVSLTYTLPSKWIPGTSSSSISVAARELHTWTDYAGIDPEVRQIVSSTPQQIEDQAITPPLTRFIVTFRVVF